MTTEQIQQFFTSFAEIKADIKNVAGDIGDVKKHLDKLNGKTESTQDRVTILETELKPIKTIVNRVVLGVVSSFLATVGYMIYRR